MIYLSVIIKLNIVSEESTDNQPTRFKSKDELLSNYDREKKFLKGFQVVNKLIICSHLL